MKNEDENKENNPLTLAAIVCKWYTGAAVGFVLGNLNGNSTVTCIGLIVGAIVGWLFQRYFNK